MPTPEERNIWTEWWLLTKLQEKRSRTGLLELEIDFSIEYTVGVFEVLANGDEPDPNPFHNNAPPIDELTDVIYRLHREGIYSVEPGQTKTAFAFRLSKIKFEQKYASCQKKTATLEKQHTKKTGKGYTPSTPQMLKCGNFKLNPVEATLQYKRMRQIMFNPGISEIKFLLMLWENCNKVTEYKDIATKLSINPYTEGRKDETREIIRTNKNCSRVVNDMKRNLRERLRLDGLTNQGIRELSQMIQPIKKIGYRFVCSKCPAKKPSKNH